MENDIGRILIDRHRIAERVHEMAVEIAGAYPDNEAGLTLVPILSGSVIFLADLIRHLPMKMKIGMLTVSSYRGATIHPGEVHLVQHEPLNVEGVHVLIIDDILDTGRTLQRVSGELAAHRPLSIRIAVLLRKPANGPRSSMADYVGFDIEDEFVVGYGLDYNGHYRNYPHIAVLRDELYRALTPE